VPDADAGRHAAALVAELVVQRVGVEIRAPGHRVQVADARVAAAHVGLGVGADTHARPFLAGPRLRCPDRGGRRLAERAA